MAIRSWFSRLFARKTPARRRPRARLLLEALEDRTLLNSYLAAGRGLAGEQAAEPGRSWHGSSPRRVWACGQ